MFKLLYLLLIISIVGCTSDKKTDQGNDVAKPKTSDVAQESDPKPDVCLKCGGKLSASVAQCPGCGAEADQRNSGREEESKKTNATAADTKGKAENENSTETKTVKNTTINKSKTQLLKTGAEELISILKGHAAPVTCVAFSSNGKRIASGSGDKSIKIWNTETGRLELTLDIPRSVDSIAFSRNGNRIASHANGTATKLWNAQTGQLELTLGNSSSAGYVAFSNNGKRLASGSRDKSVKVWNTDTGQLELTLGNSSSAGYVAFSNNGKWIASSSRDKPVKVWNATTGDHELKLKNSSSVNSVVFSPDDKRVAGGWEEKKVKVWNALTGQLELTLDSKHYGVKCVAFSSDGKRIASGTKGSESVEIWNATTGDHELTLNGHSEGVNCVAFSPVGNRIAAGGEDKTVRIWDLDVAGRAVKVLPIAHHQDINSNSTALDPVVELLLGKQQTGYQKHGYKDINLGDSFETLSKTKHLHQQKGLDMNTCMYVGSNGGIYIFDSDQRLVFYLKAYHGVPGDLIEPIVEMFGKTTQKIKNTKRSGRDSVTFRNTLSYHFSKVFVRIVMDDTRTVRFGQVVKSGVTYISVTDRQWLVSMLTQTATTRRERFEWLRSVSNLVENESVAEQRLPVLPHCERVNLRLTKPKLFIEPDQAYSYYDTSKSSYNKVTDRPFKDLVAEIACVQDKLTPHPHRIKYFMVYDFKRNLRDAVVDVFGQEKYQEKNRWDEESGINALSVTPLSDLLIEMNSLFAQSRFPPKDGTIEFVRPDQGAYYYEWKTATGLEVTCAFDDRVRILWRSKRKL